MECINSREELSDTLNSYDGCVIYGAGLVGTCMIQYMIKEKISSKIVCIAVKSKTGNPVSIMGIPVCELQELAPYKERYLFLITTLEHLQQSITEELNEFGCKNITGISNAYFANMRETVNDYTPDIMCALQKGLANMYENFTNIYNKIDMVKDELTYLIEEQNEISAVNTKAFSGYQNCYRGRDIVIVATGPTLNDYEPVEGAIHIGVNTAYKNPKIPLDYLFVQDARPEFLNQGKFEGINKVKCKIFMGRVLKRSTYEYTEFPEEYRISKNIQEYVVDHDWPKERIYIDICNHPVSGGVTVVFSALQFALYTYPRRIFLVGCDTSTAGHFDGTIDVECPIDDCAIDNIKKRYKLTKNFAQLHYPETEIISINPVGLKGMFRDIYTK